MIYDNIGELNWPYTTGSAAFVHPEIKAEIAAKVESFIRAAALRIG